MRLKGYQESTYGDRIADVYDERHANLSGPDHVAPIVDVLAELAGDGRALELGVGTGRIALPLAARGIEVHGIDASETMLQKLRQKPGGASIPVTLGDFAELEVEETILPYLRGLQYVLFPTDAGTPAQVLQ